MLKLRRNFLLQSVAFTCTFMLAPEISWADSQNSVLSQLKIDPNDRCSEHHAAIIASKKRWNAINLPTHGKLILVNIASQKLMAYENRQFAFQMKVVVGAPEHQTPQMSTWVDFVRFNPTWVVPSSVLKEQEWQDRLKNPQFIKDYGFKAFDASGRRVNSSQAGEIVRLEQTASDDNALGLVKFGLHNGNAIYLHDTTAKEGFLQNIRSTSHGCVRVERPFELAGWILGTNTQMAENLQQKGDITNYKNFSRVNVILGYFTAWPNFNGQIEYSTDIYNLDKNVDPYNRCEQTSDTNQKLNNQYDYDNAPYAFDDLN